MSIFNLVDASLWQAHLESDPDSIRLSFDTVMEWANTGDISTKNYRLTMVASALEFDRVVFYAIPKHDMSGYRYVGYRYGAEPDEYRAFLTCNM
jgi:hypothetical protein